ncbi:MAG: UDP-glucose 4-epimerase GalE [Flammeovirgaceae bacterium]
MDKILITGGLGYIGSHTIIEIIRQTNWEVVSVDNCVNSSTEAIKNIEAITHKKIVNHQIDLCDLTATREVFRKEENISGIIHFAALKSVPDSVANPVQYYHNNMNALFNVLRCCKEFGVPHFIFSSSCSIYGNVAQLPVDETTPFGHAESPYAATKQMGERVLEDYANVNDDLQIIALRYFNPVGADATGLNGENPINPPTALVPYITQTAVGIFPKLTVFGNDYNTRDGSCIRDYIHVTDLALAHINALQFLLKGKNELNYDTINIGSGQGVTVLEAVKEFIEVSGVELNYEIGPRRAGDVEAIYSNSEKALKLLGWKPQLGIREMMDSAWKWQQHLEAEKV